ncbi:rhodanese-like domain-containing protein [Bacillus massiliigorillae]|uniref:rhodanese-like domain-containing protein n=1 Tax=Bacillus massiliigorillae TaxID=1243664 RepID=UPI0003A3E376|nr:rhodanese-like domain-containing protein [Bacillus massiliigorillae]
MQIISPKELQSKIKENEVIILDVRAKEKYEQNHISDSNVHSINIPKTSIFELDNHNVETLAALPKNKEIIVTCTTGNSARKCASILADKAYQVTLLEGGITAWNEYKEANDNK